MENARAVVQNRFIEVRFKKSWEEVHSTSVEGEAIE